MMASYAEIGFCEWSVFLADQTWAYPKPDPRIVVLRVVKISPSNPKDVWQRIALMPAGFHDGNRFEVENREGRVWIELSRTAKGSTADGDRGVFEMTPALSASSEPLVGKTDSE